MSIAVMPALGTSPQEASRAIRQPAASVLLHAMAAPAEPYPPANCPESAMPGSTVTDNWPGSGTILGCASPGSSAVAKTLVKQEGTAGRSRGARGDCRGAQT